MKRVSSLLAAAALSLGFASGASAELKIGFIYVGPVEDLGWTFRHDEGRKAIEQLFGNKVSTTFI